MWRQKNFFFTKHYTSKEEAVKTSFVFSHKIAQIAVTKVNYSPMGSLFGELLLCPWEKKKHLRMCLYPGEA